MINGQVISGSTVFEYLGKIVDSKQKQNQNLNETSNNSQDISNSENGECKINENGELEGWCSSGSSVEYSLITDDNDDFTKKKYKIDSNLSFLENSLSDTLNSQVKEMEKVDNNLSQKRQQFDNDYERLQKERGEIGIPISRK